MECRGTSKKIVIARPKTVAISIAVKTSNVLNAEDAKNAEGSENIRVKLKGFLEIIFLIITVLLGMLLAYWFLMGLIELPILGDAVVYEYEDVILYFVELLLIAILFVGCFKTCRKLSS